MINNTFRGLTPGGGSSHRCWRSWFPGKPALPYSGWAAWHLSCGSRPAWRRTRSWGGSPRWSGWRWRRGRRRWACWTCSPCCWAWLLLSRTRIRPPCGPAVEWTRDNEHHMVETGSGTNFVTLTPAIFNSTETDSTGDAAKCYEKTTRKTRRSHNKKASPPSLPLTMSVSVTFKAQYSLKLKKEAHLGT